MLSILLGAPSGSSSAGATGSTSEVATSGSLEVSGVGAELGYNVH